MIKRIFGCGCLALAAFSGCDRPVQDDQPVVMISNLFLPMIFKEFEPYADAILLCFNIHEQAAPDVVCGRYEPLGLLSAGMESVERQDEDVLADMACHRDSEGNTYDFGFGLNWSGWIEDARTERYPRR